MTFVGVMILMPRFIVVIMGLERNTAAVGQQADAVHILQGQALCILCQTIQRPLQPSGQRRPDPDHQISLRQIAGFGGAHGIAVGRRAGRDDQIGAACPLHHHSYQRMHRRDVGGDAGYLCVGQSGRKKEGGAKQTAHKGAPIKCYTITLIDHTL